VLTSAGRGASLNSLSTSGGEQSSEESMASMTENRLHHLPVMEGDQLIGLVSIGDLVKAAISEQQLIIEQLEHYISGQRN
jgi:CBS domain-containing protein